MSPIIWDDLDYDHPEHDFKIYHSMAQYPVKKIDNYLLVPTLKALIFTGTNFCGNKVSREFILAIQNFDYFARTYFREFRDFFNFEVLLSTLN